MKLMLCLALFDLASTLTPPERPITPSAVRWMPRLTLRFTQRGGSSRWAESLDDARSVPLGTTLELRLEWSFERTSTRNLPELL